MFFQVLAILVGLFVNPASADPQDVAACRDFDQNDTSAQSTTSPKRYGSIRAWRKRTNGAASVTSISART